MESAMNAIRTGDASCRKIFTLLTRIYGYDLFTREIGFFVTRGLISVETAQGLEARLNDGIKELAPSALKIVESFGIPEHTVRAPIAQDYEKYQEGKYEGEYPEAKL
jgi:acyl-CoA oxidase